MTSDPYVSFVQSLTDDEFENERFTIREEYELIGMSDDEAIYKTNVLDVDAYRRSGIAKAQS